MSNKILSSEFSSEYPRHDDPNDEQPINDNQCVQNDPTTYHTRYGRACLPNSRYQNDYV